eukprot:1158442-Pelagomonas_calceolata.AAC.4
MPEQAGFNVHSMQAPNYRAGTASSHSACVSIRIRLATHIATNKDTASSSASKPFSQHHWRALSKSVTACVGRSVPGCVGRRSEQKPFKIHPPAGFERLVGALCTSYSGGVSILCVLAAAPAAAGGEAPAAETMGTR